jgi:hypothetical protein
MRIGDHKRDNRLNDVKEHIKNDIRRWKPHGKVSSVFQAIKFHTSAEDRSVPELRLCAPHVNTDSAADRYPVSINSDSEL